MMDVRLQRTARVLWGVTTMFTLYATMIPFTFVGSSDVVREHLAEAVARSAMSEFGRLSRADFLQNILLFVPFGLFAVASFSRARAVKTLVTVVVTAAVLSLMCESLQLMTVDRISSLWDVYANVFGASLGGDRGARYTRTRAADRVASAAAGTSDAIDLPCRRSGGAGLHRRVGAVRRDSRRWNCLVEGQAVRDRNLDRVATSYRRTADGAQVWNARVAVSRACCANPESGGLEGGCWQLRVGSCSVVHSRRRSS